MLQVSFLPDINHAKELDITVRKRVADSLQYAAAQARGQIEISDTSLNLALNKLRRHEPVSPAVFGSYYDIVISIQQNDLERIQQAFSSLEKIDQDVPEFAIRAFSPSELGKENYDIYNRFSDCDPENTLNLVPPSENNFSLTRSRFQRAMELLDNATPALAGEIRELLCEIIIADQAQPLQKESQVFGSLSSPYLWGAAFMKADSYSILEAAVTIIHESSHMLLFALSMDGHMANNPYHQRLESPIRRDARPMEGIFHATFVLARMCYGTKALLESGTLDQGELTEGKDMLENLKQCFNEGLATVENAGKLTEQGQKVMATTKAHMLQSGILAPAA